MRISDWSSDVCSSDLEGQEERSVWVRRVTVVALHLVTPFMHDRRRQVVGGMVFECGWAQLHPPQQLSVERHHDGRRAHQHCGKRRWHVDPRSEEHTSELQSLMRISYAVFCLKKKTTQ